jgi:hypothetical protein
MGSLKSCEHRVLKIKKAHTFFLYSNTQEAVKSMVFCQLVPAQAVTAKENLPCAVYFSIKSAGLRLGRIFEQMSSRPYVSKRGSPLLLYFCRALCARQKSG